MGDLVRFHILPFVIIRQPEKRPVGIPSGPILLPVLGTSVEAAFICGSARPVFRFPDTDDVKIEVSFIHYPVADLFLCVFAAFAGKLHGWFFPDQKFLQSFMVRDTLPLQKIKDPATARPLKAFSFSSEEPIRFEVIA